MHALFYTLCSFALLQVDYSDSDLEMPDNTDTDPTWNSKKQAEQAKTASRRRPSSKSCTLLAASESDEEVTAKSRSRRGRGEIMKKAPTQNSTPEMHRRHPHGKLDIPSVEILRSIKEEQEWLLDLSIDELRASDTEEKKFSKGKKLLVKLQHPRTNKN